MRIRRLLHEGFVHFWHWLNCLEILFFFSVDRFPFNLTDTCIVSPSFLTLMRKKATSLFYILEDIFSPALSQFCEPQKTLYQLNLVLYVGESKT